MSTASFRLIVGPVGLGSVEVNGEDISNLVSGAAVVAEVDQPTVVTLRHVGDTAEISGQGIVQVRPAGDTDGIAAFLESIDPKELERVVLEGLGPGSGSPIAEALDHLKRWARGG